MKYIKVIFYLSTLIAFALFMLIRYTLFFDGYLFSTFVLLAVITLIIISVRNSTSKKNSIALPWVFFLTLLVVAILLRMYVPSNTFR